MRFARTGVGAAVVVMMMTSVTHASTPTGTPSNPAVWPANTPRTPAIEHRPLRKHTAPRHEAVTDPHRVPSQPRHSSPFVHRGDPGSPRIDPLRSCAVPPADPETQQAFKRRQRAEKALRTAQLYLTSGKFNEAVEQLDMAAELEPTWTAPVLLRAYTFGELALRYRPSAAFLSMQAADLQRLLALEPNVDTPARARLLQHVQETIDDARKKESRRRRMTTPAVLTGTVSAALLLGGIVVATSTIPPSHSEVPGRWKYVSSGVALASVGAALAPLALSLAILGARQSRRDHAAREMSAHTGRQYPILAVSPTGLGLLF